MWWASSTEHEEMIIYVGMGPDVDSPDLQEISSKFVATHETMKF